MTLRKKILGSSNNLRLFVFLLLSIFTLTSCEKDRNCMCGSKEKPQLEAVGLYHDTKKNATKKCEDLEKEIRKSFPDAECELVK